MFPLLFIAFVSAENDCSFKTPSSTIDAVDKIAEPSRGFLRHFLKDTLSYYPGPDVFTGDDLSNYLIGAICFAIPFALMFIICLIYFIAFSCCSCCCCCHAKGTAKPGIIAIIIHFIAVACFVICALLQFISASAILKGAEGFIEFPTNLGDELHYVFDKVNTIFDDTFEAAENTVSFIKNDLTSFVDFLDSEQGNAQNQAEAADASINNYQKKYATGSFAEDHEKLLPLISNNNELHGRFQIMKESLQPAVEAVTQLTTKLKDASLSIQDASSTMKKAINTTISDVQETINEYRNGDLMDSFKDFEDNIDDITDDMDDLFDIIAPFLNILKIVLFVISGILLAIAVLYGIMFFCANCCSRCLACSFPAFGILFTLVILLPALIFSAIFLIMYDICPDLAAVAQSFIDDSSESSLKALNIRSLSNARLLESSFTGNISALLVCEEELPIMDYIDLGFNTSEIIDTIREEANKTFNENPLGDFVDGDIANLAGFGENFDIDTNISSDQMLYEHSTVMPQVKQYFEENNNTQVPTVENMITQINDGEEDLQKTKEAMKSVLSFGSRIFPETDALQNRTKNVVNDFTEELDGIINEGLDNITCKSIKCIYSPIKNALCADLFEGFSLWIISGIILTIGQLVMSVSMCVRRRKGMGKAKVEQSSEEEEEDLSDVKENYKY